MTLPGSASPAQLLYHDLADELTKTRAIVALVPDGNNDWKPHGKSFSLGALATHLCELPGFTLMLLNTAELDFAAQKWTPTVLDTTAERLAHFDKIAQELTDAVTAVSWDKLNESWTMRMGEQVYFSEVKAKLLRTMGISHIIHHRAQLGTYLRAHNLAIPGAYGPSADEM